MLKTSSDPSVLSRRTALSLLLTLPFATSALAQSYPDRPIRMIVPFAPGGITDVSARLVAQLMSVSMKQSVVIENRAGGGGTIGATAVARAEPDGYTLLISSSATNAILPAMYEKLDYDPIKSFLPIARISSAPYLLIVNAEVPVKNARELADYIKANPKFAFAAPTGTPPHILAFVFKELTGVDFARRLVQGRRAGDDRLVRQPDPGDLSGNDHRSAARERQARPHPRHRGAGALAPAARCSDPGRAGFPAADRRFLERAQRAGGYGSDIVRRLNHEVNESLKSPELKAIYAKLGITANIVSPDQFGAFIKDEAVRWDALVKASKLPKVR